MPQTPTITLHFSQAILQACERLGIVLPAQLLTAVRSHPARVPLPLQDEMWTAIEAAQRSPLIGLRIGLEVQVGHLDSAGLLLMSCETLGDALEALLEYFPIISEGSVIDTVTDERCVRIRYTPGYEICQATRAEAALACISHLTRWMTGDRVLPAEICLRHEARTAPATYRALLGCPVRFQGDAYSLTYTRDALSKPLIQANAALRQHLQQVADRMLASLSAHGTASQVQALLRHHPRWGKERVAELLGISGRHLNRRLADEGSSFKLLRDATLHQMAVERLQSEESLRSIAVALGFSDESAFAKAFRRWTGLSPAQYRRQLEQSQDKP